MGALAADVNKPERHILDVDDVVVDALGGFTGVEDVLLGRYIILQINRNQTKIWNILEFQRLIKDKVYLMPYPYCKYMVDYVHHLMMH